MAANNLPIFHRFDALSPDRVEMTGLRPTSLPHHRTCGFPHPAVEPSDLMWSQNPMEAFPSHLHSAPSISPSPKSRLVLCGGAVELVKAGFETLTEAG